MVNILIAEAEPRITLGMQFALESVGHRVIGVVSFHEAALQQAIALRPQIMIMDIDLADTIACINTAHHIQTQLDIPIVLLTASTDEAVINQAMTISPFGYLVKPFLPEQLQITVDLGMIRYQQLKRIEAEIQELDRAIC